MAIGNSIKSQEYGNDKQILIAPETAVEISCIVSATGVSANAEGRKIVKAGTPLGASDDVYVERQTPLTEATDNTVKGVLLHDRDVTDGDANGTLVITGTIDLLKLDTDVATKLKTAVVNLKDVKAMNGYKG